MAPEAVSEALVLVCSTVRGESLLRPGTEVCSTKSFTGPGLVRMLPVCPEKEAAEKLARQEAAKGLTLNERVLLIDVVWTAATRSRAQHSFSECLLLREQPG